MENPSEPPHQGVQCNQGWIYTIFIVNDFIFQDFFTTTYSNSKFGL